MNHPQALVLSLLIGRFGRQILLPIGVKNQDVATVGEPT